MGTDKLNRFEMRADDTFLKSVDDWRRLQPDLPNCSEAIRRLVEAGLKASAPVQEGIKIMKPIRFKKR